MKLSEIDPATIPRPPAGEVWRKVEFWELRYSDVARDCRLFRQMVRDGVSIDGVLELEHGIPEFQIRLTKQAKYSISYISISLTPEYESFLLNYLFTGENRGFPTYHKNSETPKFRAEADYLYKHIKRETERGAAIFRSEEKDEIKGTHVTAKYPFGSIDYGFFPLTQEELIAKLETVEPYHYSFLPTDVPELQNNRLPIDLRTVDAGEHLDSVFKEIPTNTIIDKTVCGIGATWLEIHSKRNSIIIEPNVPVIIGKEQQHPNIIGVYGDNMPTAKIIERITAQEGQPIKLMTTPDSYPKVTSALKKLHIPYLQDYFLLFDECEKIVADIDYRQDMTLPIDDFFLFQNKAMVSATPIVINDPRFEEQKFTIIKIKPAYDHSKELEIRPTNNVEVMLHRLFAQLKEDATPICVFYNSVRGIKELIVNFKIGDDTNVYCSTEARKQLHKEGYHVFDSVTDKNGKISLKRYNFFTSRFYSALDINLDFKPTVIMISRVYKTIEGLVSPTLIDPETEAIQIVGRFRNGVKQIIHVTDTNPDTTYQSREELEQFLQEQHREFHRLLDLRPQAETKGEQFLINQAIENVDYNRLGFVTDKGEINYFRYNNAYLDERLKMLYRHSAILNKAYRRSGAFKILSQSEYSTYTELERRKLLNRSDSKADRITLLFEVLQRLRQSDETYDRRFYDELKEEYGLYCEAFDVIGFRKVRELQFKDADIRTEVKQVRYLKEVTSEAIITEIYEAFKPNTTYSTTVINKGLQQIFDAHKIEYDRRGIGKSITLYFDAEESRTGIERVWKLGSQRFLNG